MQGQCNTSYPSQVSSRRHLVFLHQNRELSLVIQRELEVDGFTVEVARSLTASRVGRAREDVDLLVIGEMASVSGGLKVLRAVRAGELASSLEREVRVLYVAPEEQGKRIAPRAFDLGADDVVRAPFVYAELLARIRRLLDRGDHSDNQTQAIVIRYGRLVIETLPRRVMFGAVPVELCRMEYSMLLYLIAEPGRVFAKDEILRDVWGYRSTGSTRTVDSHASRVRKKLVQAGAAERVIESIWGVGYRFNAPDEHNELHVVGGARRAA